jgi:hypothetical protein
MEVEESDKLSAVGKNIYFIPPACGPKACKISLLPFSEWNCVRAVKLV